MAGSLCELFEISEQEALGIGWTNRVHPDDRERVAAGRRHAASPIPVFYLDYRIQLPNKIQGRIGTITDITDAKNHFGDGAGAR